MTCSLYIKGSWYEKIVYLNQMPFFYEDQVKAYVWSELIPQKRVEFLDIAYEVGESREIMGIPYPSDEEASRTLAHRMLSSMWDNPNFQKDLIAAKSEWKNWKEN